jgi:hypothetical protein
VEVNLLVDTRSSNRSNQHVSDTEHHEQFGYSVSIICCKCNDHGCGTAGDNGEPWTGRNPTVLRVMHRLLTQNKLSGSRHLPLTGLLKSISALNLLQPDHPAWQHRTQILCTGWLIVSYISSIDLAIPIFRLKSGS